MKKLVRVLLLLVAGCGPQTSPQDNQSVPLQENPLANLQLPDPTKDTAHLQSLIDRAMPFALPDAASARYRGVRAGVGGSVCGEVAAKAANAPFLHFVITPDAIPVVGTAPGIKFNDPSDFLADAWIRWCASPEELKLVEAQITSGPAPSADGSDAAKTVPPVDEDLLRASGGPAAPKQKAAPPPPTTQIDSFAKSVRRPQ